MEECSNHVICHAFSEKPQNTPLCSRSEVLHGVLRIQNEATCEVCDVAGSCVLLTRCNHKFCFDCYRHCFNFREIEEPVSLIRNWKINSRKMIQISV